MYAEATSGSGGIGDGTGDDLIVYGSVNALPVLTITSPNGGEIWQSGTSQDIIWTSTGYSSTIDIEYYNGTSYVLIADDETNDGTYSWFVPGSLEGNNYRIRISDNYSNITISDESDADITISTTASDETDITAFSFTEQTGAATIDAVAHTVAVDVAYGTNVTNLIATFELSAGATAAVGATAQESGISANDFSSDLTYTITAQDGLTTQDWTVSVSEEIPSTDATLTDLLVDGSTIAGFDAGTVAYDVELPYGTSTVPTVTYSLSDATATVIQTNASSLPGTTSVEVTAQDGTTKKDYRINFTVAAPSSEATVTSASYTVDDGNETLTDIPYGTTLATFKAALTPATGAAFDVYLADGTTLATDLLSGYKVVVTAQDGTTQKTYTLTVNEPVIDLFFSEYIEGSSSNKALEIYNPTGSEVDLSAYSVKLGTNGADWGTTLGLSGTITAGEVYVIYNSSAVQAIKDVGDISSGVANFNGDDAVACLKTIYLSMSLVRWAKTREQPGRLPTMPAVQWTKPWCERPQLIWEPSPGPLRQERMLMIPNGWYMIRMNYHI
ncbi:MAG: lamin tail domain-containing protein [Salinivirgaceae bacterium]